LRYQWFDEIGEEYDYMVTAHHANDNAETVIMNLMRGTGLRGICGIPPKNGKGVRPLLKFSASALEKYGLEQKIKFCVDSSNLSDDFLRNRIRHHIIPEMEKINPNVIDVFSKNCTLFQQQTQFFDAHIQQYKNQLLQEKDNRATISIETLRSIENQSLVLYEILNPFGFHADDVENILKSMNSNSGKQFFSDTHILIKDRTHFIIETKTAQKEQDIIIHNIEELEQYGFKVEKNTKNPDFSAIKSSKIIYVDIAKLNFPLTIRGWKSGDFFYPFGMKTKKKVSDFFTDLKIDLLEKQKIRILCSQDDIVWIVGYRADERFRVADDTESYYIINLKI
jgi:tRNA(Ile)-lysidine synthase